ncbi:MAG TPA: transposase [Steroidobacteraceae bacterium]|nr:transposase [Steroidobacteraceae bacterium]HQZ81525.1 transposase [Steroidobacteraceae bacterium]
MRDPNAVSFTRTLRLKVKCEAYPWLNAAAMEVNQVWNWANATSADAADRNKRAHAKFLSGFDLCNLSAGATEYFERIGADTIQRINCEYAIKRRAAKRSRLRWRVSRGARRSLGWVPFKAASIKRKGSGLRFCGKSFRVFDADRLTDTKWCDGCFAQDACGDWWLCLPVAYAAQFLPASDRAVGVDLGCKDAAVTSDGDRLTSGHYRSLEPQIAQAQRRGHKRQAKRLHRKAANRRQDAQHQFSRMLVNQYQKIVVGDVSSLKLAKTRMAKSVLDAGWGALKNQLAYKSEHAGRQFQVVNENYTTRACGNCGALSGPKGVGQLVVRRWECVDCGAVHDRDVNAARNILTAGLRCRASVRGNESSPPSARRAGPHRPRATGISAKAGAA